MERAVPWNVLVEIIEPYWPKSKTGRPPFAIETMLRIHYMQQWFGLSDPAMEQALHDVPQYLEFAGLSSGAGRIPDEATILRFRRLRTSTTWPWACCASPTSCCGARG